MCRHYKPSRLMKRSVQDTILVRFVAKTKSRSQCCQFRYPLCIVLHSTFRNQRSQNKFCSTGRRYENKIIKINVTECIVYMFRDHDPITFSFRSFSFLIGWGFMAQLSKVLKVVCWAGSVPFPPVSLQRQVVCLTVAAGVHVFIARESL